MSEFIQKVERSLDNIQLFNSKIEHTGLYWYWSLSERVFCLAQRGNRTPIRRVKRDWFFIEDFAYWLRKTSLPKRRRASIPLVCSDGGRAAAGFAEEKNDCTVRALANATGTTYAESHALWKSLGRESGKGANLFWNIVFINKWLAPKGLKLTNTFLPKKIVLGNVKLSIAKKSVPTLRSFIKAHPKGVYLCQTRDHAFAIRDGVVHDSFAWSDLTRIVHSWNVEQL